MYLRPGAPCLPPPPQPCAPPPSPLTAGSLCSWGLVLHDLQVSGSRIWGRRGPLLLPGHDLCRGHVHSGNHRNPTGETSGGVSWLSHVPWIPPAGPAIQESHRESQMGFCLDRLPSPVGETGDNNYVTQAAVAPQASPKVSAFRVVLSSSLEGFQGFSIIGMCSK